MPTAPVAPVRVSRASSTPPVGFRPAAPVCSARAIVTALESAALPRSTHTRSGARQCSQIMALARPSTPCAASSPESPRFAFSGEQFSGSLYLLVVVDGDAVVVRRRADGSRTRREREPRIGTRRAATGRRGGLRAALADTAVAAVAAVAVPPSLAYVIRARRAKLREAGQGARTSFGRARLAARLGSPLASAALGRLGQPSLATNSTIMGGWASAAARGVRLCGGTTPCFAASPVGGAASGGGRREPGVGR